jgi:signal peptidase I
VGPPPDDDAVKQETADAEDEQVGVSGAGEPRGREDALAECDQLLADAARVMQDARTVSQRLRDDTLAEVEAQAGRLIAEAEQARDAIIGDARRIRDEVLAEADAEAERRQAETEQAHLAAVDEAETRARALRQEAEAHARDLRDEAEAHARELRDIAVAAATAEAEREARRHEAEAAAERRARDEAFRAELERKQAAVLEVSVTQAERLLAEAAAAAEEHRAQAEHEAARTLIEARAEGERLNAAALAEGREEVARLLAETLAQGRAEVQRLLAAAADERGRLLEDAQREVRELVRQAEADSRLVRAEATRWFAERARDVAAIALPGQVATPEAPPQTKPETQPDSTVAGRSRARRVVGEIMLLIAVPMIAAFFLKSYVAQAFYIPSASMEPKLEEGDRVIVSKLAYRLQSPGRADVIVFHPPVPAPEDHAALPLRALHGVLAAVGIRQPGDDTFIKRVVGLPGETVEGREGRVFVDGAPLDEPYLDPGVVTSDFAPVHLGDSQLFVMGDNRTNSSDSRSFGPVDRRRVVGEATTRAWPPPRAGFL